MKQKRPTISNAKRETSTLNVLNSPHSCNHCLCSILLIFFFSLSLEIEPQASFLLCIFEPGVRTRYVIWFGCFPNQSQNCKQTVARIESTSHGPWPLQNHCKYCHDSLHLCAKYAEKVHIKFAILSTRQRIYVKYGLRMNWATKHLT